MKSENTKSIFIPGDRTLPIQRQSDGQAVRLHCTGGFRASQGSDDAWLVEPVLDGGIPSARGFLSRSELQALIQRANFIPIAFENMGWVNGSYYSSWSPIVPKRTIHLRGPADLWGSIATNITEARTSNALNEMPRANKKQLATILDAYTQEEALAQYISYSLRSMDVSMEGIVTFYNEQLVNLSANGNFSGQLVSSTSDKRLYSDVHSFFLHLGAARDYLGTYLALRIGMDIKKVDDMARLVNALRSQSFGVEPVLDHLRESGFLVPKPNSAKKWQLGGWLKDASDLRRQFVHKRPYGTRFSETCGRLNPVDQKSGIFRYFRPIHIDDDTECDVLDEIVSQYKQCTEMFQDAAEKSGLNTAITTLSDADIVAVKSPI